MSGNTSYRFASAETGITFWSLRPMRLLRDNQRGGMGSAAGRILAQLESRLHLYEIVRLPKQPTEHARGGGTQRKYHDDQGSKASEKLDRIMTHPL